MFLTIIIKAFGFNGLAFGFNGLAFGFNGRSLALMMVSQKVRKIKIRKITS
jgi:hypothetical protein